METSIQEGNERLLRLADHLTEGLLGHKYFDFQVFNSFEYGWKAEDLKGPHGCGTHGCAIGECPVVFEDDWYFEGTFQKPYLRNVPVRNLYDTKISFEHASIFFSLTEDQTYLLFLPDAELIDGVPISPLGEKATRYEVAQNIKAFVAWREGS